MAIRDDVLVVGGGLAGMVSALAATRAAPDARVRVLSHKESTLQSASGLVDVLGYRPGDDTPVATPFDALDALPDDHPYRVVGEEAIRDGLALFDDVVGDAYAGGHTDRNALVPTHGGTVKPTARYPRTTAAGLASDDRDALLVGFPATTDFDAERAAAHLENAGVPFEVDGVTVPFPLDLRDDAKVTRYAHALDADEPVESDDRSGDVGVRAQLAAAVEPHLDGHGRVGFPALLGRDHPTDVRESLEGHLGVDVFEVPTGPPSLPGLRLRYRLRGALDDAGVRVATGNPVVDFDAADGRVETLYVERNGARIPYEPNQVVLATGGLVGKGIRSDRSRVAEPVFGLHVPHPDDRYDWFAEGAFGDHPFARFGVRVDDALRPTDADGTAEYENLRAAGAVVAGVDFAAEKSGAGVSLATGHAAGTRAGEATRADTPTD
ncbi:glycerol-3-phosphate dehydrogenase subunit GlpB [Halorarum halophilum]|uniref:Glycerol-3-phosphate dehydrogenase subunit GlpB n=1 Tax=Halorarum halophilum TaxID=2743090 RepID=A0A7D5GDW6_9EURY|nr:glycerol-3-phosphate dehydrogenase subunit GlpB [Halobaculum halophilum]QLG29312.1 glycerol-3-phosphate dehydrogenase subunit GlpB [Halobaculum halophilum]